MLSIFTEIGSEVIKGHIFWQTRAMHATPEVINFFSENAPESKSVVSEDINIFLKAYSMKKVGTGGNFESEK